MSLSSIPPERKPYLPSFRNANHRVGDRVCTDINLPSKRWIAGSNYHTPAYYKSPPVDVVEERRAAHKGETWRNPRVDLGTVQHTSIDRRSLIVKLDSDGSLKQFDSRQLMQSNAGRSLCNQQMKSLNETILKEEKLRSFHDANHNQESEEQEEQKNALVAQKSQDANLYASSKSSRSRIAAELAETVKYGNTLPLPGMFTPPPNNRSYSRPCMANLYTHHVVSPTETGNAAISANAANESAPEVTKAASILNSSSTLGPIQPVSDTTDTPNSVSSTEETSQQLQTSGSEASVSASAPTTEAKVDEQSIANLQQSGSQQQGTTLVIKAADGSSQTIIVPFQVASLAVCGDTPVVVPITAQPSLVPGLKPAPLPTARRGTMSRPSTGRLLRSLPARRFAETSNVPAANLPTYQIARPGSAVRPNSAIPKTSKPTPQEMRSQQQYQSQDPYDASMSTPRTRHSVCARPQTARAKINPSQFTSDAVPLAKWEAEGLGSTQFMSFDYLTPSGRRPATASTNKALRTHTPVQLQAMVTTPAVEIGSGSFVYRG